MLRVGVLASGRGSNLESLLRWQAAGILGARVVVAVSNHRDARALEVARSHGVEACVCGRREGEDREATHRRLSDILTQRGVELVALAGYDRILAPGFVRQWAGRMLNIHPSLLPAFAGSLHAQEDALRHGVKVSGCTVHLVTEDVDGGPIVSQAAVPVLPSDDRDSLAARILEEEHRLLPAAVRAYAEGRLELVGTRIIVREE